MKFGSTKPVLIPIDMQRAFDDLPWTGMDNPRIDSNAARLLAAWRTAGWPIMHIQHSSLEPNSTLAAGHAGHALRPGSEPLPGELLLSKSINCAFTGTDLDLRLRRLRTTHVVLYGISIDMCVSTSVRIGSNLGYKVTLVEDACAAFDLLGWNGGTVPAQSIRASHLATLNAEFCRVETTDAVLTALAAASAGEPIDQEPLARLG